MRAPDRRRAQGAASARARQAAAVAARPWPRCRLGRAMACKASSSGAPTRPRRAGWPDRQHRTVDGHERPHSGPAAGRVQLSLSGRVSLVWASRSLDRGFHAERRRTRRTSGRSRRRALMPLTEMHRWRRGSCGRRTVVAAELATVVHMEFAATVAAAQKSGRAAASPSRAVPLSVVRAHAGRIIGDCAELCSNSSQVMYA